jgi:hypothetical protein
MRVGGRGVGSETGGQKKRIAWTGSIRRIDMTVSRIDPQTVR